VAHYRQVDNVIADVGGLFRLKIFLRQDFSEGSKFVAYTLVDVLDLEIAGTEAHSFRDALGNDAGFDASEAGERKCSAVMGVETFGFDLVIAAGRDQEKLAVGHDPIDIQQQELYLLCTRL
jgi:hypothetical protein